MSDLLPESASFEPFRGLLFSDPHATDEGVMELDDVIAPLAARDDASLRQTLQTRNVFNIAALFERPEAVEGWKSEGWLEQGAQPALYLYRIGFTDAEHQPRQWSGVFGRVSGQREGEETVQLVPDLIEVRAEGFSELLVPLGMPLARATDGQGSHHRLWPLTQGGVVALIADAVHAHGHPALGRLNPGALVLAFESTETFHEPALGMVLAP
jgi:hypothetical protein